MAGGRRVIAELVYAEGEDEECPQTSRKVRPGGVYAVM